MVHVTFARLGYWSADQVRRTIYTRPLRKRQPLPRLRVAQYAPYERPNRRAWGQLTSLAPFVNYLTEHPNRAGGERGQYDGIVSEHCALQPIKSLLEKLVIEKRAI
jgi:hypothetical protein